MHTSEKERETERVRERESERERKKDTASFYKDASVVECVATCPIFCHTTITLHKMYLIILK